MAVLAVCGKWSHDFSTIYIQQNNVKLDPSNDIAFIKNNCDIQFFYLKLLALETVAISQDIS